MLQNGKALALVAHEGRKRDLSDWWRLNRQQLANKTIYTNLERQDLPWETNVVRVPSSEDGGEIKIGGMIVDGAIGAFVYFWNPTVAHAHDADVKALIRTAIHHNTVVALNRNTADHILAPRGDSSAFKGTRLSRSAKRLALVAHDSEKDKLVEWCSKRTMDLSRHLLCGTGTTAQRIRAATSLSVEGLRSGPDGGDFQIGARIVDGDLDYMFLFFSTTDAQPHDVDVKALLRIAVQFNVSLACNVNTAERLIGSDVFAKSTTERSEAYRASQRISRC